MNVFWSCVRNKKTTNLYAYNFTVWVFIYVFIIRITRFHRLYLHFVYEHKQTYIKQFLFRILRLAVNIDRIDTDLGDYISDDNNHLQVIRENLLHSLYTSIISDIDFNRVNSFTGGYYTGDDLKKFAARIVVHLYWKQLAGQLLLWGASEQHEGDKILLAAIPGMASEWRSFLKQRFYLVLIPGTSITREMLTWLLRLCKRYTLTIFKKNNHAQFSLNKRIAVQMVMGPMPRRRAGDFDWLANSNMQGIDLVYYLDGEVRQGIDLSDVTKWCNEQSIQFSDLRKWSPSYSSFDYGKRLYHIIKGIFLLPFSKSSQWNTLSFAGLVSSSFSSYAEYWRIFLLENNICGCINIADTNLSALPQLWAIESVGGVDLSFEFSATGYHSYMDARPLGRHQYAGWGKLSLEMIENCEKDAGMRISPDYLFQMGNMRHYLRHRKFPELEAIHHFMSNYDGLVIGIFDSIWTRLKVLSRQQAEIFMTAVFEFIDLYPDALFVFKPQKGLAINEQQQQRLDKMVVNRNAIVVESEILPHQLYQYMDIVIGSPIYSSALMEAMSARVPVIYFDDFHWPHIIRSRLPSELLVRNADELFIAVKKIISKPVDERLPSKLIKEIDRFGDDHGNDRWGFLLSLWLREINRTGTADSALLSVVEAYRFRYGFDSVLPSRWATSDLVTMEQA